MKRELWKAIKGYEGLYEVSNLGNVRSLDRVVTYKNGTKTRHLGRELTQEDVKGYRRVTLSKNGKTKRYQVHRLVAVNFIDNPENKLFVNHIDGNKSHNTIDNLEWCTSQENEQHSYEVLGKQTVRGEEKTQSKLTEKDVLEIRSLYEKGYLQRELAEMFNVGRRHISDIVNFKRWGWLENGA